jgi:hypothetical protein
LIAITNILHFLKRLKDHVTPVLTELGVEDFEDLAVVFNDSDLWWTLKSKMSASDFEKLTHAYQLRTSNRSCEEDSDKEGPVVSPSILDELEARIKSLRSAMDQTSKTEERIKEMEAEIVRLESDKMSESRNRISKEICTSRRLIATKRKRNIMSSKVIFFKFY